MSEKLANKNLPSLSLYTPSPCATLRSPMLNTNCGTSMRAQMQEWSPLRAELSVSIYPSQRRIWDFGIRVGLRASVFGESVPLLTSLLQAFQSSGSKTLGFRVWGCCCRPGDCFFAFGFEFSILSARLVV